MDDPTVIANYGAALRSGQFSTVVRYNMRCAGQSRGKSRSHSPDADDLVSLCRHLLTKPMPPGREETEGRLPRRLVLIAYSYGSCVAAEALARVPEVSSKQPSVFACRNRSNGRPLGTAKSSASHLTSLFPRTFSPWMHQNRRWSLS